MCNLNIFLKTEVLKSNSIKNLVSFLTCVTSNSFISNNDSEGYYFNHKNTLIKSNNKINLIKQIDNINQSNFILAHQRFKTSGSNSLKYSHPFKNKDFIMLHNGILSSFAKGRDSDTYILFKNFIEDFKGYGNREKRIIESLKNLLNKISGSYSIALYDIKTKKLYYFKNDSTIIYFYMSKDKKELYITTSFNNESYLELYQYKKNKFKDFDVKDFNIYRIDIENNQININVIDRLKKSKQFKFNFEGLEDYKKEKSINDNYNNYSNLIDYIDYLDISGYCDECHTKTYNFDHKNQSFICEDCLKFDKLYKRSLDNRPEKLKKIRDISNKTSINKTKILEKFV